MKVSVIGGAGYVGLITGLGVSTMGHQVIATDIDKDKIIHLRIFSDQDKKMNLSIQDINGEILLISQFTLLANTKKGRRPSFINSANPKLANQLYNTFIQELEKSNLIVKTGEFGATMDVKLINTGPATFILNSQI